MDCRKPQPEDKGDPRPPVVDGWYAEAGIMLDQVFVSPAKRPFTADGPLNEPFWLNGAFLPDDANLVALVDTFRAANPKFHLYSVQGWGPGRTSLVGSSVKPAEDDLEVKYQQEGARWKETERRRASGF